MKEAFRKEAQRTGLDTSFAWLSVVASMTLSCALSIFWVFVLRSDPLVVVLLFVSVVIEAAAEPVLYERLRQADYACKIRAESFANLFRSVILAVVVYSGKFEKIAFAISQLSFSLVWLFLIFDRPFPKISRLRQFPAGFPNFLLLTSLKLILTEIEKIILLAFFDENSWAQFGLVSNFGSLILRTFFAPIEDVAYSSFSRKDFSALTPIFFLQTVLGLAAASFGPAMAAEAVLILYGRNWAAQPGIADLLGKYCILIFLCAVNGITEAHFFATAKPEQLESAGVRHSVAAGAQILASVALAPMGPAALVAGNSLGMSVRILGCWVPGFSEIVTGRRIEYLSLVTGGVLTQWLPKTHHSLAGVITLAAISSVPALRQILKDFTK